MSTRSIIAHVGKNEGEFKGVYAHSDGYPTWMGRQLLRILRERFGGDVKRFMKEMITAHPGGWSVFGESCYCHRDDKRTQEPRMVFTHENFARGENGSAEWLWVFDSENNKLFVRDLNHKEDVALIDLIGPEPDWSKIECGENFERCGHYAWYHGLLPKTSQLSTQTWLERRPLEFRDAIAVIVSGRRYKMTGSGGDSDFMGKHQYPAGTWISSVIAGNGKRLEIPTAVRTQDGYKPYHGVTWVYPPTKNNPNETEVKE